MSLLRGGRRRQMTTKKVIKRARGRSDEHAVMNRPRRRWLWLWISPASYGPHRRRLVGLVHDHEVIFRAVAARYVKCTVHRQYVMGLSRGAASCFPVSAVSTTSESDLSHGFRRISKATWRTRAPGATISARASMVSIIERAVHVLPSPVSRPSTAGSP